jgi:hypothetical protein
MAIAAEIFMDWMLQRKTPGGLRALGVETIARTTPQWRRIRWKGYLLDGSERLTAGLRKTDGRECFAAA